MLSAILFLLCDIHVIYHMTKRELNSYYFELSNVIIKISLNWLLKKTYIVKMYAR